ncbi:GMC family oxidoreductase [Leucobacter salsicius]|uniref:GMC family oxidoreductase n=1 Tax=Leucobacter salsicius TaxID=664638 RepID=UPI00034D8964|nr:GMC family oxidoreductase [Leucobacter salsicius]
MTETVIIVGAGSAGCTVAARLSEDGDRNVILLDAGADQGGDAEILSVNWLDALEHRQAFYPDLFASKVHGGKRLLYQRGRGVGGSASTNAMLALPGLPSDYDNYASQYGLSRWSWLHVEPWFAKLQSTLTRSTQEEQTPVDQALLASGRVLGLAESVDSYTAEDGSALLYRTADREGRRSSRELWLEPARARENLIVRPDSQVDRLMFDGNRVVGVVLVGGEELRGDRVILCAGTFETPSILLRSGMTHSGIGRGLQDHPAASVYFTMTPECREANREIPCIGAVMRLSSSVGTGDIHLLPLHGELLPGTHGLLMAAVMRTKSVGSLRLNPKNLLAPPIVDEEMLAHPDDKKAMREALAAVAKVLSGEAFAPIVEEVFIDEKGTPLSAIEDDEFFERWLSQYVGDYFHAVGTARMGQANDPDAVVDELGNVFGFEGLSIWDASILPEVPSANTHLPVVMLAERMSAAYRSGALV